MVFPTVINLNAYCPVRRTILRSNSKKLLWEIAGLNYYGKLRGQITMGNAPLSDSWQKNVAELVRQRRCVKNSLLWELASPLSDRWQKNVAELVRQKRCVEKFPFRLTYSLVGKKQ